MAKPQISDVFDPDEEQLLCEALYALRRVKQEALETTQQHPATGAFTAVDFGIPSIDALLKRLGGAPEIAAQHASDLSPDELAALCEALHIDTYQDEENGHTGPDSPWGWTDGDKGSGASYRTQDVARVAAIDALFKEWLSEAPEGEQTFGTFVQSVEGAAERPRP